jgi:hypothetical protein
MSYSDTARIINQLDRVVAILEGNAIIAVTPDEAVAIAACARTNTFNIGTIADRLYLGGRTQCVAKLQIISDLDDQVFMERYEALCQELLEAKP